MRISDWSSDVCSSDLITKRRKESIDFLGIWNAQKVDPVLESAIAVVSGVVNDDIIRPPQGISNISEWCKKEACWTRIQARTDAIANLLPPEFSDRLFPQDDQAGRSEKRRVGKEWVRPCKARWSRCH